MARCGVQRSKKEEKIKMSRKQTIIFEEHRVESTMEARQYQGDIREGKKRIVKGNLRVKGKKKGDAVGKTLHQTRTRKRRPLGEESLCKMVETALVTRWKSTPGRKRGIGKPQGGGRHLGQR